MGVGEGIFQLAQVAAGLCARRVVGTGLAGGTVAMEAVLGEAMVATWSVCEEWDVGCQDLFLAVVSTSAHGIGIGPLSVVGWLDG